MLHMCTSDADQTLEGSVQSRQGQASSAAMGSYKERHTCTAMFMAPVQPVSPTAGSAVDMQEQS